MRTRTGRACPPASAPLDDASTSDVARCGFALDAIRHSSSCNTRLSAHCTAALFSSCEFVDASLSAATPCSAARRRRCIARTLSTGLDLTTLERTSAHGKQRLRHVAGDKPYFSRASAVLHFSRASAALQPSFSSPSAVLQPAFSGASDVLQPHFRRTSQPRFNQLQLHFSCTSTALELSCVSATLQPRCVSSAL